MSRESILFSMKKYYGDFHRSGVWDEDKAIAFMTSKNYQELRIKLIRSIYECVLNTSCANETTRKWISTSHSIQDVAMMMGISFDNAKSQVTYVNKQILEFAVWDNINIFQYLILAKNVSKDEMDEINYKTSQIMFKLSPRLISRNELLINVPSKQFRTTVDADEYAVFLQLINPYIVSQRSKAQQELNGLTNAVEYFNYIMTPGMALSAYDLQMRDKTLALFEKDVKDRFVDKVMDEKNKINEIRNKAHERGEVFLEKYGKYMSELDEEEYKDYITPRSTRIQY